MKTGTRNSCLCRYQKLQLEHNYLLGLNSKRAPTRLTKLHGEYWRIFSIFSPWNLSLLSSQIFSAQTLLHTFLYFMQLRPVLRIRDVYLGSRILIFIHPGLDLGSRIPDPTTAPKEEGEIFVCHTIFVATNIIKFK